MWFFSSFSSHSEQIQMKVIILMAISPLPAAAPRSPWGFQAILTQPCTCWTIYSQLHHQHCHKLAATQPGLTRISHETSQILIYLHKAELALQREDELMVGGWCMLLWCTAPSLLITLCTLQMCRDGLVYYFSKKSPLNSNHIKLHVH